MSPTRSTIRMSTSAGCRNRQARFPVSRLEGEDVISAMRNDQPFAGQACNKKNFFKAGFVAIAPESNVRGKAAASCDHHVARSQHSEAELIVQPFLGAPRR